MRKKIIRLIPLLFFFQLSACKTHIFEVLSNDDPQPVTENSENGRQEPETLNNDSSDAETNKEVVVQDDPVAPNPFAAPEGASVFLEGDRVFSLMPQRRELFQAADYEEETKKEIVALPVVDRDSPQHLALFDNGTGLFNTLADADEFVNLSHRLRKVESYPFARLCDSGEGGIDHFSGFFSVQSEEDDRPVLEVASREYEGEENELSHVHVVDVNGTCDNEITTPAACFAVATLGEEELICENQADLCTPQPDICSEGPLECTAQEPICVSQQPICTDAITDHNGRTVSPATCTPQPDICTPQPDICVPGPQTCVAQQDICVPQEPNCYTSEPEIEDVMFFEKAQNGCAQVQRIIMEEFSDEESDDRIPAVFLEELQEVD